MRLSKLIFIFILTIFTLTLVSCNNKNTPINQLEELSEDLKQNSKDYTEDDWAAISQSLENIHAEIEEHRTEYTEEELKEIGRLKGICGVYLTRYAIKNASVRIRDAIRQFSGALDGAKEVLDKDSSFLDVDLDKE